MLEMGGEPMRTIVLTRAPFYPVSAVKMAIGVKTMPADNGLELDTLAQTAYSVMASLNEGWPDWTLLVQGAREKWYDVAATAIRQIEQADGLKFVALAEALYLEYSRLPEWDTQNAAKPFALLEIDEMLRWEAVGRHLANLIDSDGEDLNFSEMEAYWKPWLADKGATCKL